MNWGELISRWYKPAIALAVVYAAGAVIGVVGDVVDVNWPSGDVGHFDVFGISVRGLFDLAFATLAKLVVMLGTLAIAIKILTESVSDHVILRMKSEGMK